MGNQRSTSYDSGLNLKFRMKSFSNNGRLSPGHLGTKRRRCLSSDSLESSNSTDYGWFEDFESPALQKGLSSEQFTLKPLQRALSLPPPAGEVPLYVLESSLETQQLWYKTAGRRPRQPSQEREYFEKLWSKNIEQSSIPIECYENKKKETNIIPNTNSTRNYEVLYRGKASFSYSVNKSFPDSQIAAMSIHMPYYRICRDERGHIFAEFLVVVSVGSHGAVTFGIWKRYSEFQQLARRLTEISQRVGDLYKNTMLSWQCVLQRKRWIKSLDKDYLSVKCFLIGRFMHDLLFESPNPTLINTFLGLE